MSTAPTSCTSKLASRLAPRVRRDGEEARELDYVEAHAQDVQFLIYDILSDEQIQRFENDLELCFEHKMALSRHSTRKFNGLAMRDRGSIAATLRVVPAA